MGESREQDKASATNGPESTENLVNTTEYDRFANTLREGFKVLGLGMAASQSWDACYVPAVFVAVDNHSEFRWRFHDPDSSMARASPDYRVKESECQESIKN